MTLEGTCGLQAEQQLVLKTMKPLYPKPHRNQLLEGLRPTLELNTFHRWPGVSCSPLPQGLHQTLLPLQLKLKGLAVRQRRCPGQRASQGSNSVTEYRQVLTANGRERAQRQLQLGQKHAFCMCISRSQELIIYILTYVSMFSSCIYF